MKETKSNINDPTKSAVEGNNFWPGFLNLLDSDPEKAKHEFADFIQMLFKIRIPYPLRTMSKEDREDCIQDFYLFCTKNDFYTLRKYKDVGKPFALWLRKVAEDYLVYGGKFQNNLKLVEESDSDFAAIDHLIRSAMAIDLEADDFVRPSDEILWAYLNGKASEEERKEVQLALTRSKSFGKELLELIEDFEYLSSEEAALAFDEAVSKRSLYLLISRIWLGMQALLTPPKVAIALGGAAAVLLLIFNLDHLKKWVSPPRESTSQIVELEHTDTPNSLNEQVTSLYEEDKYEQTIPFAKRALEITEETLGSDQPGIIIGSFNGVSAHVLMDDDYALMEAYDKAEPLPHKVVALPAANVLNVAYLESPPPLTANVARPQLQFEILAKRNHETDFRVLKDGDSLTSEINDYWIVARPLSSGYLYIFQVDSTGKTEWLFPENPSSKLSSGTNPVASEQTIQLPSAESGRAFYLDTTTGVEHIYAVFSATRWLELEEVLAQPNSFTTPQSNETLLAMKVQEPNGLRFRGVGGLRTETTPVEGEEVISLAWSYQGRPFTLSIPSQPLEASGSFLVAERWFRHVNSATGVEVAVASYDYNKLSRFIPSYPGAAKTRVGGGTRQLDKESLLPIVEVLASQHDGLTTQSQPTLYWFVSKTITQNIHVTLTAENEIEPIWDRMIEGVETAGIQKFDLAQENVTLDLGMRYNWDVAVVMDPSSRSADIFVSCGIRRIQPSEKLKNALDEVTESEYAAIYSEYGIWFDMLHALNEQIRIYPDNQDLRTARIRLFKNVKLESTANFETKKITPLVNPSHSHN